MQTDKSKRAGARGDSQLRRVVIKPGISPYAEGSVEVSFGNTKLYVTASVEKELPRWKADKTNQGWITAEYGMLPRSTHTRMSREASSGKQGGRTLEIQRLIGRALRQAIPLEAIPGLTIKLDCDVISADGGTRTAAISGAWVALAQALRWCQKNGLADASESLRQVAAVSVGTKAGRFLLDLDYEEDSNADFDLNLVFNESKELIEIQGTGEARAIGQDELMQLVRLGSEAIEGVFSEQRRALGEIE